ncbi:MAG: invasin domain 3-containing protein, partial [Myxococcales bacterium]
MRKVVVLSTGLLALFAIGCSEPVRPPSVAARLEVQLGAQRISADEGRVVAIARLFDSNDAPMGGAPVTFSSTAGTVETSIDNGDGSYSVPVTALTAAGSFTVRAHHEELVAEATGTIVPGRVDATLSTLNVAPAEAAADGKSFVTATVKASDAHGNALGEGRNVQLRGLGSAARIETPVWDATLGGWTAKITNQTAEQVTVSASVDNVELANKVQVTFKTPTHRIELQASATSATVTSPIVVTARVIQVESNTAMPGRTVVLESDSSTSQLSGNVMTDNRDGTYAASITDTRAARVRVTARDLASGSSASVDLTFVSGAPTTLALTTDLRTISADVARVTATATLTDIAGNPIANRPVALTTSTGAVGSVKDNGDGTYSADVTGLTSAGIVTLEASLADVPRASARVTVNPGGLDVARSSVVAAPTTVAGDGRSVAVVTVIPMDQHGNRLGRGQRVALESTSTTSVIGTVRDQGDGLYTATVTDTRAVSAQLTARVGAFSPVALQTRPTITFDAPQFAFAMSATQTSLAAGQTSTVTARVTTVPGGQPATGRTVTFSVASGRGATLGPVSEISPGVFTVTVLDTVAEQVVILARDSTASANGAQVLDFSPEPTARTVELSAPQPRITADA